MTATMVITAPNGTSVAISIQPDMFYRLSAADFAKRYLVPALEQLRPLEATA